MIEINILSMRYFCIHLTFILLINTSCVYCILWLINWGGVFNRLRINNFHIPFTNYQYYTSSLLLNYHLQRISNTNVLYERNIDMENADYLIQYKWIKDIEKLRFILYFYYWIREFVTQHEKHNIQMFNDYWSLFIGF